MVNANVVVELKTLIWINRKRNISPKVKAYSFSITYDIIYSNYCFVADKVSSNISEKSNRHTSGTWLLYKRG